MDAIGMMVTRIEDGLISFTEIGGIDPRILPGQPVTIHGQQDIPGIVAERPAELRNPKNTGSTQLNDLLIDTGLPLEEVSTYIALGSPISFAQAPLEFNKHYLGGHSLDNRASVAALTICLEKLQKLSHDWDVWAVATVQEEETLGGAATSAFELRPTLAVAIDVTFGASPGASGYETFPLGKGPALGWGPNIHPGIHQAFKKAAEQIEMNVQIEVMPRHSGTDAIATQVTAYGIPSMVLSIPLRYMHTPVEVVNLKDVERAGRLLAELIHSLDVTFMDQLTWDDDKTDE